MPDSEMKIVYGIVASEDELIEIAKQSRVEALYSEFNDLDDQEDLIDSLLEEFYNGNGCSLFSINDWMESRDYVLCDSPTERTIDEGQVEHLDVLTFQEEPENESLRDLADDLGKECHWMIIHRSY